MRNERLHGLSRPLVRLDHPGLELHAHRGIPLHLDRPEARRPFGNFDHSEHQELFVETLGEVPDPGPGEEAALSIKVEGLPSLARHRVALGIAFFADHRRGIIDRAAVLAFVAFDMRKSALRIR